MKHSATIFTLTAILSFFTFGAFAQNPTDGILYVKKGSTGDGSSWDNAIGELNEALIWAKDSKEDILPGEVLQIWVSAGTYLPTYDSSRGVSFEAVNGVSIYGGFAGTESSLSERDWFTNQTILSGDLNGDDEDNFTNNEENSYLVLKANDATFILDGITIIGANASDAPGSIIGGGINSYSSIITIRNSTLTKNYGVMGGAMYNNNSYLDISNSWIVENQTKAGGAGLYQSANKINAYNTVFKGNKSGYGGGAAFAIATLCEAYLEKCLFIDNEANDGNGVGSGGAIQLDVASKLKLVNSVLVNNKANGSTDDGGGAIMIYSNSSVEISNSTLYNNSTNSTIAPKSNAIARDMGSTLKITNSIITGEHLNQIEASQITSSSNSLIRGIDSFDNADIFSNINDLAGADGIWGTEDDGLAILENPLVVNAGDNSAYLGSDIQTDLDFAGNKRFSGQSIDIGAYEFQEDDDKTSARSTKTESIISIFPNPSSGNIQIKSKSKIKEISLYDLNGKQLLEKKTNDFQVEINLSNYTSGIYFLKTRTEEGIEVSKIIKE